MSVYPVYRGWGLALLTARMSLLYDIRSEKIKTALKHVTCLLHVPNADDVRPVLKCFGEERICYAQNDRGPEKAHKNPNPKCHLKAAE